VAARAIAAAQSAGGAVTVGCYLELLDALGLKAFGAFSDGKLYRFAFVKRTVSFSLDGGVMDENIISGRALDKPITFRVVEPFHYTLFSIHIVPVFLFCC
jgi:hypothetical protein